MVRKLEWIWNESGINGIKHNWGDGRPSKLTEDDKKELKEDIIKFGLKTTNQIKKHIEDKWNIDYAVSWLPTVLRSIGAKYGKPYIKNIEEGEHTEEIIHNQIREIKKEKIYKKTLFSFLWTRSYSK
jgi:transposase